MRGKSLSREEKVAKKMLSFVDDVTIDLDELGKAVAKSEPTVLYNRFILVAEAAVQEREDENERYRVHY